MSEFKLGRFIRKKLLKRADTSDDILNHLRKGGAEIGTDVVIFSPKKTTIDETSPFLLKIGDHVRITQGVIILTHDYSWSVLKRYAAEDIRPGNILGAQSAVEIGSNVFIGMNAIITRGVKIGDNVVIGAGSVVTKDCPSDGVYAGNPAKRIMSMEQYYRKREALQFEEAKNIAIQYRQRFGKTPPKEIFHEYFMLFAGMDEIEKTSAFRNQMGRMDNYDESVLYRKANSPRFSDYESFLKACYEETAEEAITGSTPE